MGQEANRQADRAGQQAFRLWMEKERDRAVAESARRYLDYLLFQRNQSFSSQRLWEELEQVQKWLKDPENVKLPEPLTDQPVRRLPPPYPYYPYLYPPTPYYPSPYVSPGYWFPSPYYPPVPNVTGDGGYDGENAYGEARRHD